MGLMYLLIWVYHQDFPDMVCQTYHDEAVEKAVLDKYNIEHYNCSYKILRKTQIEIVTEKHCLALYSRQVGLADLNQATVCLSLAPHYLEMLLSYIYALYSKPLTSSSSK